MITNGCCISQQLNGSRKNIKMKNVANLKVIFSRFLQAHHALYKREQQPEDILRRREGGKRKINVGP